MRNLRWRDHEPCFDMILNSIREKDENKAYDIISAVDVCTMGDTYAKEFILGVDPSHIAFLEYLFHKAQGPYSSDFEWIAEIIALFFMRAPPLQNLINLNAPDTLANMVLNKRGRLKFLISDQLELGIILNWWIMFGLNLVTSKEVFEAILNKPTYRDRLKQGDPLLMLRLLDVFPDFSDDINPKGVSRETLVNEAGTISHPPSERRYHQVYAAYMQEGRDLKRCIEVEESRILPMQMKRNRFLAYLVKKLHDNRCQICTIRGEDTRGPVDVHHIIPLSQEGKDRADNMLVVCKTHHQAIHAGQITIRLGEEAVHIRGVDENWIVISEL